MLLVHLVLTDEILSHPEMTHRRAANFSRIRMLCQCLTSQHLSSPRMANIFCLIDSEVGQCRFWTTLVWTVGHFTIITTIVNRLLIFYNYCAKFFSVLGECTGTDTVLPKNKYNIVCVFPSVSKLETSCSIVKFSSNTNSNHTRNLTVRRFSQSAVIKHVYKFLNTWIQSKINK